MVSALTFSALTTNTAAPTAPTFSHLPHPPLTASQTALATTSAPTKKRRPGRVETLLARLATRIQAHGAVMPKGNPELPNTKAITSADGNVRVFLTPAYTFTRMVVTRDPKTNRVTSRRKEDVLIPPTVTAKRLNVMDMSPNAINHAVFQPNANGELTFVGGRMPSPAYLSTLESNGELTFVGGRMPVGTDPNHLSVPKEQKGVFQALKALLAGFREPQSAAAVLPKPEKLDAAA
jgi:hypothetical protein